MRFYIADVYVYTYNNLILYKNQKSLCIFGLCFSILKTNKKRS